MYWYKEQVLYGRRYQDVWEWEEGVVWGDGSGEAVGGPFK